MLFFLIKIANAKLLFKKVQIMQIIKKKDIEDNINRLVGRKNKPKAKLNIDELGYINNLLDIEYNTNKINNNINKKFDMD